jgi:prevent-host-death family protein
MATITIHKAKTNLSKLIERALAGEEIVIARGKQPVVKLVPVVTGFTDANPSADGFAEAPAPFESKEQYERAKKRGYGAVPELADIADEFFAPLSEDELKDWYGD